MDIYINKIKWVVGSDKLPVGRIEVIKKNSDQESQRRVFWESNIGKEKI